MATDTKVPPYPSGPPTSQPPRRPDSEDEHNRVYRGVSFRRGGWFKNPKAQPTAPAEGPDGPGWRLPFPQRPTCFSPPLQGLIDTGPKAQNGVGPKVT